MKKNYGLIGALLVAIFILAFGVGARAETYIHGYFLYDVKDESVTITSYTGKETEVTVPNMIGGHPVNTIAKGAFANCPSVVKVNLPDTIMTVEEGAFQLGQTVVYNSNLGQGIESGNAGSGSGDAGNSGSAGSDGSNAGSGSGNAGNSGSAGSDGNNAGSGSGNAGNSGSAGSDGNNAGSGSGNAGNSGSAGSDGNNAGSGSGNAGNAGSAGSDGNNAGSGSGNAGNTGSAGNGNTGNAGNIGNGDAQESTYGSEEVDLGDEDEMTGKAANDDASAKREESSAEKSMPDEDMVIVTLPTVENANEGEKSFPYLLVAVIGGVLLAGVGILVARHVMKQP